MDKFPKPVSSAAFRKTRRPVQHVALLLLLTSPPLLLPITTSLFLFKLSIIYKLSQKLSPHTSEIITTGALLLFF